jgi:prephenate dehydrogenase
LHLADEASAAATVAAVLDAGRDGRSLLAVKHPGLRGMDSASRPASRPDTGAAGAGAGAGDEPRQAYVWVEVHLQDRPGQLAAVLAAAAEADVNVEDVRLEHATHAAAGTLSLAVSSAEAPRLQALLDARALGHRGE